MFLSSFLKLFHLLLLQRNADVDRTIQHYVQPQIVIDHFTVVCLMTWPLDGSEAGVDLVLIQTSLLLLCKTCCSNTNEMHLHDKSSEVCIKTRSTPASLPSESRVTEQTTVKRSIVGDLYDMDLLHMYIVTVREA